MRDTSWDTPYLHGADHQVGETSEEDKSDAILSVYLEGRKIESTPEDFLQACWTHGFETSCTVCRKPFDLAKEPPVRLLSLDEHMDTIDPLTKSLPPLLIKNYHFRCLEKDQIKFIPVSHPWHPSVAEAYALRTFNAKAARTCYEVPVRTLLAVMRRFGSNYSLWHDYISIPQWQDDFRGTVILPQIFKIFEASGSAILHLGHQPPIEVIQTPDFQTICEHDEDLKRFFNAHLFTRLWPIVEADRAGEAYIMNDEYRVMQPKFSVFVRQILNAVSKGATTSHYQKTSSQWLYDLPLFIQERKKNKCLGYVYDMIADLGCRSFRDKFIGASELLGVSNYPTLLPTDTQDACLWLAERQIENNDLSALLLRPTIEPHHQKAHWLKGHTSITKDMWGWGTQTHSSSTFPRLEEHSVYLNLTLVGTITTDFSWDVPIDDHIKHASNGLLCLIKSSHGPVTEFLRGLEGFDPVRIFPSKSNAIVSRVFAKGYNIASSKVLVRLLGNLLNEQATSNDTERSAESFQMYDNVVSLLALSASVPTPELDHFEDLNHHQLRRQICDSSERNLVEISCSTCRKQSIYRVEIWQKINTEARLYLIPGLAYQYTATSGTGIIMEEGRIIGRARFCAPACNCNHSVPVKVTGTSHDPLAS